MKKQDIFSWMSTKVEIKTTDKYGNSVQPVLNELGQKVYKKKTGLGYGVFAKETIKRNEVMFVMGGYILDIDDENQLTGIVSDKPIEISEYFSIGPRKASDIRKMPQHYINHSCNPNSGFKGQLFIVAMKTIKAGTEIVYDYAMIMHPNKDSNSTLAYECVCGSKECRKKISENDWKKPDLQKKYNGYFQWYLQEKINAKLK